MAKTFFTVGPSQLYPTVPKHIENALRDDICSISHRSEKFQEIYKAAANNLKQLLGIPENWQIFFLSSATEAMERVIQNCVQEKPFHFVNGAFSKRFFEIAKQLQKNPEKIEVELGKSFAFEDIDIPQESEMICITQTETSAGTIFPLEEIYKIRQKYPEKLVVLDAVSALPYVDIDYSKIDGVFFSVQKGFGLPAGLGVLAVGEKCLAKSKKLEEKNANMGSYHSFSELLKMAEKFQTKETPNVLGIYLLGKVTEDMLEYGIEKIREETEEKARMIYDFFENSKKYSLFVDDKNIRAKTVAVLATPGGSKKIVEKLKEKAFVVGTGYKDLKEKQIRIANFPAQSVENVRRLIEAIKEI